MAVEGIGEEEAWDGQVTRGQKTPSLHRLGGGVQQEFEHSFLGTEIPFGLSKDWIIKSLWPTIAA